jgi:hypothetical protein
MTRLIALLVALAFALGAGTTLASAQPPKDPAKPQPKAPPASKQEPLDINSASADELKALKGIGEADAKKIVQNHEPSRELHDVRASRHARRMSEGRREGQSPHDVGGEHRLPARVIRNERLDVPVQ